MRVRRRCWPRSVCIEPVWTIRKTPSSRGAARPAKSSRLEADRDAGHRDARGELGHRAPHARGRLGRRHHDRRGGRQRAPHAPQVERPVQRASAARASRRAPTGPRGRRPTAGRARAASARAGERGLVRQRTRRARRRRRGRPRRPSAHALARSTSAPSGAGTPRSRSSAGPVGRPARARDAVDRRRRPGMRVEQLRVARLPAVRAAAARAGDDDRLVAVRRAGGAPSPTVRCTPAPPIGGKWRASMQHARHGAMLGPTPAST